MLIMRPGGIYLETCYKKNEASYTVHARVEDKRQYAGCKMQKSHCGHSKQ